MNKAYECQMCGRTLTDPESIANGVGPECAAKRAAFLAAGGTTIEEIDALALLDNATVIRWISLASRAMRAGCKSDFQSFVQAARNAAQVRAESEPLAPIDYSGIARASHIESAAA